MPVRFTFQIVYQENGREVNLPQVDRSRTILKGVRLLSQGVKNLAILKLEGTDYVPDESLKKEIEKKLEEKRDQEKNKAPAYDAELYMRFHALHDASRAVMKLIRQNLLNHEDMYAITDQMLETIAQLELPEETFREMATCHELLLDGVSERGK